MANLCMKNGLLPLSPGMWPVASVRGDYYAQELFLDWELTKLYHTPLPIRDLLFSYFPGIIGEEYLGGGFFERDYLLLEGKRVTYMVDHQVYGE